MTSKRKADLMIMRSSTDSSSEDFVSATPEGPPDSVEVSMTTGPTLNRNSVMGVSLLSFGTGQTPSRGSSSVLGEDIPSPLGGTATATTQKRPGGVRWMGTVTDGRRSGNGKAPVGMSSRRGGQERSTIRTAHQYSQRPTPSRWRLPPAKDPSVALTNEFHSTRTLHRRRHTALSKSWYAYPSFKTAQYSTSHETLNDDDDDTHADETIVLGRAKHFYELCRKAHIDRKNGDVAWDGVRQELYDLRELSLTFAAQIIELQREAWRFGTLFHVACALRPPVDVVATLIDITKKPLGMPDKNGDLVLHVATRHGASLKVLQLLVEAAPESVDEENHAQRTPLLIALLTGVEEGGEVVQCLALSDPVETRAVQNFASKAKPFLNLCHRAKSCSDQKQGGWVEIWQAIRRTLDELHETTDGALAEKVASVKDDQHGMVTPLHILVAARPPVDIIRDLVLMSEKSVTTADDNGDLPLHVAAKNGASIEVLQVLVDSYPEGREAENGLGQIPFFIAALKGAPKDVLGLLKSSDSGKNQEAIDMAASSMTSGSDSSQPSKGAGSFSNWKSVREELLPVLTETPEIADLQYTEYGMTGTPLHIICERDPPLDVVESLLALSKNPLGIQNESGDLPLHVATTFGASHEVIELLVRAQRESVTVKNCVGDLPLHLAIRNGAELRTIKLLVGACPEATVEKGSNGYLPLHFAINKPAEHISTDHIRVLVEGYPQGTTVRDDRGNLPLHYALANKTSPGVIYILVDACPSTVVERNRDGHHALQIAMCELPPELSFDCVRVMVTAFPQAATVKDEDGNLPLHYVLNKVKEYPRDVNDLLLQSYVDSVEKSISVDDVICLPPGHLLEHLASSSDKFTQPELIVYCHAKHLCDTDLTDFLSIMQKLPQEQQDLALAQRGIQKALRQKVTTRFSTALLMLDVLFHVVLITSYFLVSRESLEKRYTSEPIDLDAWWWFLYLSIAYFALREVAQIISLGKTQHVDLWLFDTFNLFEVVNIALLTTSTVLMRTGGGSDNAVRILIMFTGAANWLNLLILLKSTYLAFSVFISGFLNILFVLVPFIITSALVLGAFAYMYYIDSFKYLDDTGPFAECNNELNFCSFQQAYLKTYTMMVSIDSGDFTIGGDSTKWLTIAFAFLFVVVLLNVLIAVVGSSYEEVSNRGRAIFWRDRYVYVVEVVALKELLCFRDKFNKSEKGASEERWTQIYIYGKDWSDNHSSQGSVQRLAVRFLHLLYMIIWLVVGLVTLGTLWPPQVREWLWNAGEGVHEDDMDVVKDELSEMKEEMDEMRRDMKHYNDELRDDVRKQLEEMTALISSLANR